MKVFRIEMEVAATAYIKAENFGEAYKKAAEMINGAIYLDDMQESDVQISGLPFNDPALPEASLSPAMTVVSADPDSMEEVE